MADTVETELHSNQLNFIRCDSEYEQYDINASNSRILLDLVCPGNLRGTCSDDKLLWTCKTCKRNVEYNFDSYIYCGCGRSNMFNFSFKCGNADHQLYTKFVNDTLRQALNHLKPYREVNLLILGPTGVGKSTLINSIINYLSYDTLEEAKVGGVLHVIPVRFTTMNDEYQEQVVEIGGTDSNENQATGQSSTQDPKTYAIKFNNTIFRIIDTPGIGDVRGVDRDKINTNKIVKHISHFVHIHAICILLKPNETRLHTYFSFCIKELLINLHKSSSANIIFCFTNARATLYRPGNTLPLLRKLLDESVPDIVLTKKIMYTMDNESFRYLCTLKYPNISWSESEKKSYQESWDTSVAEIKRMMSHIQSLPPHAIRETTSLCQVRRMILNLTQPLADISKNILNNIIRIKEQEKRINESKETEEDLQKKMYIKQVKLEPQKLDRPRTVCTHNDCVESFVHENVTQIYYTKHCHPTCYLDGIIPEQHPNPGLKDCTAMGGTNNCISCTHRWEQHMHIKYNQERKTVDVLDKNVLADIETRRTNREKIEILVAELNKTKKLQEEEQNLITKVGVKLGDFLRKNAITPYNDATKDYIKIQINEQKGRPNKTDTDRKWLEALEDLLAQYEQEKAILDASRYNTSNKEMTLTEVNMLINSLFNLKINGDAIKKSYDIVTQATSSIQSYKEKYIPLNKRKPKKVNRISDSYCGIS